MTMPLSIAGRKRPVDQPAADKKSPSGKKHCAEAHPQKTGERSCVKLVVKNSEVKATYGAGLGVFVAGHKGEVVFCQGCEAHGHTGRHGVLADKKAIKEQAGW